MNAKHTTAEIHLASLIFVGLAPLTLSFTEAGIILLIKTDFRYLLWTIQTMAFVSLLSSKTIRQHKLLSGLAAIYIFVPLSFVFGENGVNFLILDCRVSTLLSWAIGSLLLAKTFLVRTHNIREVQ